MCSGKVFYDIKKQQNLSDKDDIAIVRIEQLYPFPYDDLEAILNTYPNLLEIVGVKKSQQTKARGLVIDTEFKEFLIDLRKTLKLHWLVDLLLQHLQLE